jgi:ABC-type bacteriocin/lantibiotic exporter with double-glycine peptidase domain
VQDINLNSPLIVSDALKTEDSKLKFHKLELKNISFRYSQTNTEVISNLSLNIDRNQSVGIIGKSGSGKTTMINIFLGLLTPQKGTIEVNGLPINNNLRRWLDMVAYIPQDVFILDDTIRRNIAMGVPDEEIDMEKLTQSINVAQLKDVVNRLPDNIEAVVGERGIRLSGGERQRLALARAFYHEREVIIMDEATAALDNETERQLVRAINEFKTNKTMIIIAHRLSTLKDCNIIYKVDNGRIIDSGSLESLGEIQSLL